MAASALDVFRGLVAEAATKLPDMVLDAGPGTITAMIRAHTLGASVIKVFPADTLGGPALIKSVRGPCAWLTLIPSSGVTLDEANLKAWFAAGVHCVGMGSHLVDAKTLAEGRFAELADRARTLVTMLAKA
ncbi:MAG: hypothetical protein NTW36_02970 [Planctomycetia bacterium]|nr:hypothetical protein [Planctomycetia bacterium]